MFICSCGNKTKVIRYQSGKKVCDNCSFKNLSGQFLRNLEGEARFYQKEILQPYNKDGTINKDYEEVYGIYKKS